MWYVLPIGDFVPLVKKREDEKRSGNEEERSKKRRENRRRVGKRDWQRKGECRIKLMKSASCHRSRSIGWRVSSGSSKFGAPFSFQTREKREVSRLLETEIQPTLRCHL